MPKEYKTLKFTDSYFGRKAMERKMNKLSEKGWTLKDETTSKRFLKKGRILVVMEREKPEKEPSKKGILSIKGSDLSRKQKWIVYGFIFFMLIGLINIIGDSSVPSPSNTATTTPEQSTPADEATPIDEPPALETTNTEQPAPVDGPPALGTTNPERHKTMAYIKAQAYVELALKSPSTADFPFLDFSSVHLGDYRYQVASYVDAQNSFGAVLRSNWAATMKFNGGYDDDSANWELEKLVMDGELIYPVN